jgi:hypothetical protein
VARERTIAARPAVATERQTTQELRKSRTTVTDVTDAPAGRAHTRFMILSILIPLLIAAGLGISFRSERRGGLIDEHRYANRYSDAPGARADKLDS